MNAPHDPTPTIDMRLDTIDPAEWRAELLRHGGEKYEQGFDDGTSRGFLRGICTAAIAALIVMPPTLIMLAKCESSASAYYDEVTIEVELCFVAPDGTHWYTDGEMFYTTIKDVWYVAPSMNLAGATPVGRGKRVRVHGNGRYA